MLRLKGFATEGMLVFFAASCIIALNLKASNDKKTFAVSEVLRFLKSPNATNEKQLIALRLCKKRGGQLSEENAKAFEEYLLNPSYNFSADIYSEVVSFLLESGYYTKNLKKKLKESMLDHIADEKYAASILTILPICAVEKKKNGDIKDSERLTPVYIEDLQDLKKEVYEKSNYKVFLWLLKNGKERLDSALCYFSKTETNTILTLLIEDLKEAQAPNINVLKALDSPVVKPFIPEDMALPVLIKLTQKKNLGPVDTETIDSILSGLLYIQPPRKGWNAWWKQHGKKFNRRENAIKSLNENDLPCEIKVSAIMYLTGWPVKKLSDNVLKKILALSDDLNSMESKNILLAIFTEYDKKFKGNHLVSEIVEKLSQK